MKAIISEKFGSPEVLKLTEIEKPEPKDNEILIKNYASSVNTVDVLARSGEVPKVFFWTAKVLFKPLMRLGILGIRKPRVKYPGCDFAGEIVSVGKDVTDWKVGEKVYGYSDKYRTLAEFFVLSGDYNKITKMPNNLNYHEAAAVPGGGSPALTGLRDLAELQKGQKILIIGASGGIGTFAVQIAKVLGAEVTGVCGSNNLEMVKNIGADFVIDYTKQNYTKDNNKYDVIFDTVAASTLSECKNILTENGLYVSNNPLNSKRHLLYMILRNKHFKTGETTESAENLSVIREWIEEGKIKPVIDSIHPLDKVSEAHRIYESGHAKGKVVITIP